MPCTTTLRLCALTLLLLGFAGIARAAPAADADLQLRYVTPATSFNVVLVALPSFASSPAPLAGAVLYIWHRMRVGGGGFMPRLVYPSRGMELYYARADVGGAHHWNDAARRWVPLPRPANWIRIDSAAVALRHRHPGRVYLAAGIYTYTVVSAGSANNQWERTHGHV